MKLFNYLLLLLIFPGILFSQENYTVNEPDSLKNKSFHELGLEFYKHFKDTIKAPQLASFYLERAKKKKDTFRIANGYSFFIQLYRNSEKELIYIDSTIYVTNKFKHNYYPTFSHYIKGNYYRDKRIFNLSLDSYIDAYNTISEITDVELKYKVKKSIGVLHTRIGNYKEALIELKESYDFYKKNRIRKREHQSFLIVMFSLADAYTQNKKLDSATYYNKLGYKEAVLYKDTIMKSYFAMGEGINQYSKGNYTATIDSIKKVLENKNNIDISNQVFSNFYLGRSFLKLKNEEKAIKYFKKVDSIYQTIQDIEPKFREVYIELIKYYKNLNNKEKQLEYINKLLVKDSILNRNYKYLSKNIFKKYDTPELLADKERLILDLEDKNKKSSIYIKYLLTLVFILLGIIAYFYNRQRKFKKRFKELINKSNHYKDTITKVNNDDKDLFKEIGVPEEIIESTLSNLKIFIEKEKYLDKKINLQTLSKELKTNTAYLSKIINHFEKKNFSNYISSLRVNYAIQRLKEDQQFRKYAIKAIASDVGFKSTESFSKAFYKETGIYPSFFIKRIK